MRSLTRAELARYVAADEPLDCAGAYKLEARGVALFSEVRSADASAITGLPMIALVGFLRELGYPVP
jgi:septum formation protein